MRVKILIVTRQSSIVNRRVPRGRIVPLDCYAISGIARSHARKTPVIFIYFNIYDYFLSAQGENR
ncbi:MAG: hypothetical protein ABIG60_04005, partial [Patescibacteria group bacterium]